MTTKKTINKYYGIIERGLFTEQEITSFRSLLRENHRDPEVDKLLDKFFENAPYRLTAEQQKKGIDWLWKRFFTKDLEIRNTKEIGFVVNQIGTHGLRYVCEMIRYHNYFMFQDLYVEHMNIFGTPMYSPVYRLYDSLGGYFDYYYSLSTGTLEILDYVRSKEKSAS